MGDYNVVNLTGSTIHMAKNDPNGSDPIVQTYEADGRVATVRTVKVPIGEVNGVPVHLETADIFVDNVPDAAEGVVFIVPPMARAVLKGRRDVVAPDYSTAEAVDGEHIFFGYVQ